jgi:hypothetical protein
MGMGLSTSTYLWTDLRLDPNGGVTIFTDDGKLLLASEMAQKQK